MSPVPGAAASPIFSTMSCAGTWAFSAFNAELQPATRITPLTSMKICCEEHGSFCTVKIDKQICSTGSKILQFAGPISYGNRQAPKVGTLFFSGSPVPRKALSIHLGKYIA